MNPNYKKFKNSLPNNLKDTPESEYAMKRFWKSNNKPKNFQEALKLRMFTLEDDNFYHAPSVDRITLKFLKSKDHPSINKELEWFFNDNAIEFRNKFKLNTKGKFYKYIPKHGK